MPTAPYWITPLPTGRLALSPRPRGGDWLRDDLAAWQSAGVEVVVSLLTYPEQTELDLRQEEHFCTALGMTYHNHPIPDYQIPTSLPDTLALIRQIQAHLAAGQGVLVHCRGGIGRSGLIASSLLTAQGMTPDAAMALVTQIRGVDSPETEAQREWVRQFPRHYQG